MTISKCVLVLAACVAPTLCVAQNAADCASLMHFGIYDKYKTFATETEYKQIQNFFSSYQFSTRQEAESKAASLGLDIVDVLGLNFNGTTSTSNFDQWKQQVISSSYQTALSYGLQAQSIDKISNALTDLVGKCLTQKGVHAYVIPAADNQTFSVTIDFVPSGAAHASTSGALSLTPASVAASCAPAGVLGKKVDIGPQGVSLSCRRLPTETVAVAVNTDDGSPVIQYDAYVIPQPNISFTSSVDSIQDGAGVTLSWTVTNAAKVELEGYGQVATTGSIALTPNQSKQFRLITTSLDGKQISSFKSITVLPPPPVLSSAAVSFQVTNDDKDGDTTLNIYIICGGNTAAAASGQWGHWDDNSPHGPFSLTVTEHPRKDQITGACSAKLVEAPNGHDEFHFNWSIMLSFSDGTTKRYDWGGGNVDYDRTTIVQPL